MAHQSGASHRLRRQQLGWGVIGKRIPSVAHLTGQHLGVFFEHTKLLGGLINAPGNVDNALLQRSRRQLLGKAQQPLGDRASGTFERTENVGGVLNRCRDCPGSRTTHL